MFTVEKLDDQIYYFKNVIESPELFLEKIEYLNSISSKDTIFAPRVEWNASNDKDFQYGDIQRVIEKNSVNMSGEDLKLSEYVISCINDVMFKTFEYVKADQNINSDVNIYPSFCVHRYYQGASMGAHNDQQDGNKNLKYSIVIYLNDDYEGGEISFVLSDTDGELKDKPNENFTIAKENKQINFGVKPKAGSALVFPSGAPYYHTAHIIKSGKKYMIPGHWLNEAVNE